MRTSTGSEAMTTAEHCSTPGRPTWRSPTSGGFVYGTELRKNAGTDSMLISGQDYGPLVYTGDWVSNTAYRVNTFRDPFVGVHL